MVVTRSMAQEAISPPQQPENRNPPIEHDTQQKRSNPTRKASKPATKQKKQTSNSKLALKIVKPGAKPTQKCASVPEARLDREHGPSTTFFDLPAELRNEIYALVLPCDEVIRVNAVRPYIPEPCLLALNRQIRNEALPVFFGANTFEIAGSSPCTKFLRSLSDSVIKSVKCVRILNSKTASLDDGSAKWLEHTRIRLEYLQRDACKRGMGTDVIRFPFLVDAAEMWATLEEIRHISVRRNGTLTMMVNGAEDQNPAKDQSAAPINPKKE